jgi:hypothetical protein
MIWVCLTQHNVHRTARIASAANPPFLTVEHIAIAITFHAQPYVSRVTARAVRLSHYIAAPDLASQQRLQPHLLLRLGAVLGEQLHVACVWRGIIRGLRGGRASSELLAHKAVLEIREACAFLVMSFREEHVPQTEDFGFGFQFVHNGRIAPATGALPKLRFVDMVGGDAFFVDESLDLRLVSDSRLVEASQLTMSSVFLARSLTKGRTAAGILCDAVVIFDEQMLGGKQIAECGFQP